MIPGMLPARYVFILTNLCNLRCPFCFQYRRRTADPMVAEDWLSVVEQLPEYSRVTLTGGEPLVFKEFKAIFEAVTEKFDCNIISNGVLLTDEWIEEMLSRPRMRVLSVSVDDIGNHSRQMKPREWETMSNMVNRFVRARDEAGSSAVFDIKTVVLDENAGDLFDIYRYCVEELNCDTHAFQFLKGSPLQHADNMYEFDAIHQQPDPYIYKNFHVIEEQLGKVREYAGRHSKRAYLHPNIASLQSEEQLVDLSFLNEKQFDASRFQSCKFPWSSVHINADGHLFPCMAVSMGNVKQQSLAEIIEGPEFERFRNELRKQGLVPGCHRCGWLRPRQA